jgi:hypothetical protein
MLIPFDMVTGSRLSARMTHSILRSKADPDFDSGASGLGLGLAALAAFEFGERVDNISRGPMKSRLRAWGKMVNPMRSFLGGSEGMMSGLGSGKYSNQIAESERTG